MTSNDQKFVSLPVWIVTDGEQDEFATFEEQTAHSFAEKLNGQRGEKRLPVHVEQRDARILSKHFVAG